MRFYGKVGYVRSIEKDPINSPSVYTEEIKEVNYYGDVLKLNSRWEKGTGVNDDISIGHQISILADPFSYENFSWIRYVEFMGAKWKITNIEVERPRIILTLGGLYNA